MLFLFQKYLSPGWYFNISSGVCVSIPYFVDYRSLSVSERALIDFCDEYGSFDAALADAAFQAWHRGIIKSDRQCGLNLVSTKRRVRKVVLMRERVIEVCGDVFISDVFDNYRFVRRFFSPLHSVMILLLRLLGLHNPFREILAFWRSLRVKRICLWERCADVLRGDDYDCFESALVKRSPMVSVIIPTLNRYAYLKDVLSDLERQDYKVFEVIVCDQSDRIDWDFYKGWNLDLKVTEQREKALWLARNRSIQSASGEYILLYDDDSRVDSNWIREHLKCLDYFQCDISSGVSFSTVGDRVPPNYAYFRWGDQVDTGNVMFRRDLMCVTGMFDRQFERERQGDGEFGLRAYLCGTKNVSNPRAKRIHLKVATGGLRQMGSWDGLRPTKLFAPRPIPSILYLERKYFGNAAARMLLLQSVPLSLTPYKYKGNRKMSLFYLLSLIVTFPIVLTQVFISWHRSSIKLKEGDKIEFLQ